MKRLITIILLLSGTAFASCPPAKTTVSDTLYSPTGSLLTGKLKIANKTFTSPEGCVIPANTIETTVTSGALSVALVPNSGSTPSGTSYTVQYTVSNIPVSEIWVVPGSGTTNLAGVRTSPAPTPGVMIAASQLSPPSPCTDGQVLARSGNDWICSTAASGSGSGTVTNFTTGNLSPIFTASVATSTTTPALSFGLSNAAPHKYLGNNTGSTAAPAYSSIAAADLPGSITSNTSGTAAALAANGTNCSAGQHAAGVDASGNAEGCAALVNSAVAGSGISVSAATGDVTITNTGTLSFNGRAGAVSPATNDYGFSQLSGTAAKAQLPGTAVYTDQANSYSAGNKQTFTADATNAGIKVAGVTADPSTLSDGDLFFRSDVFKLYARANSATKQIAFTDSNITGTSAALAANGSNCSAGNYAAGVDASGAAEGCSVDGSSFTGLNGSNVSSGTVAKARLDSLTVFTDQVNTYTAGKKQTFAADATKAGLNFAGVTADPSTLSDGDVFYRSDLFKFYARANSATKQIAFTDSNITGTAAALAANGSNCSAGNYAAGVDASGAAEGCSVDGSSFTGLNGSNVSSGTVAKARLAAVTVFTDQTNSYTAGQKQTFTADATNAGLKFGGVTADPSSPAAGDIWYRSDTGAYRGRDGSTTHSLAFLDSSLTGFTGTVTAGQFPALTGAVTSAAGGLATSVGARDAIDASAFCSDAGSTDTYACNLSPAISSYVTGTHYRFKANTANTGAATINFNSLGAKTIKKAVGGVTTDLADNDIRAGQWVDLVYDGTNMQMQSLLGNAGTSDPCDVQFNGASFSPVDAATLFMGGLFADAPNATEANVKVMIPCSGTTIKFWARVDVFSTLGTTENVTLTLRQYTGGSFTDVSGSSTTMTWNTAAQDTGLVTVTGTFTAGDYLDIKFACPTWATNPTGVRAYGGAHVK